MTTGIYFQGPIPDLITPSSWQADPVVQIGSMTFNSGIQLTRTSLLTSGLRMEQFIDSAWVTSNLYPGVSVYDISFPSGTLITQEASGVIVRAPATGTTGTVVIGTTGAQDVAITGLGTGVGIISGSTLTTYFLGSTGYVQTGSFPVPAGSAILGTRSYIVSYGNSANLIINPQTGATLTYAPPPDSGAALSSASASKTTDVFATTNIGLKTIYLWTIGNTVTPSTIPLPSDVGSGQRIALSEDGSLIAVSSDTNIYTMTPGGSILRVVALPSGTLPTSLLSALSITNYNSGLLSSLQMPSVGTVPGEIIYQAYVTPVPPTPPVPPIPPVPPVPPTPPPPDPFVRWIERWWWMLLIVVLVIVMIIVLFVVLGATRKKKVIYYRDRAGIGVPTDATVLDEDQVQLS